jgi:ankyrin repeat protein
MSKAIYPLIAVLVICSCVSSPQIHTAVKKNDLGKVREYAMQGDIELKDSNGFTPLMLASYYGYTPIVKYLLEHGAKVDQRDNKGGTALIYASYYDYYDIVQLLLEFNASVNMQNSEGHTAFYYAEQFRYEKTAELLKAKGAKSF